MKDSQKGSMPAATLAMLPKTTAVAKTIFADASILAEVDDVFLGV